MLLRLTSVLVFLAIASSAFARGDSAPQDSRVFPLGDSGVFEPTPLTETLREGVDSKGAIYRYEVPHNWNGDLVMYAHGFRGCFRSDGTLVPLTVENPPLRAYYLANGYAWAASSYSKNCYDVKDGVESTNRLVRIFSKEVGKPNRTLITGFSMGGHVTGAAIEMFPNVRCPDGRRGYICRRFAHILGKLSGGVAYDGAAPRCGVMGDVEQFNYLSDFALAAAALAAEVNPLVQQEFPPPPDYYINKLPLIIGTLFAGDGAGYPFVLTEQGEKLKGLTREITGGDRPLFNEAFPLFQELLYGFSGADPTLDGVLPGILYDNRNRVYQFDADPVLTPAEESLNESIIRVKGNPRVNRKRFLRLQRIPEIRGRIAIPVLSVHTLGDLFVPFASEQIYAREVQSHGRSELLVSRATRAIGHCEFSSEELIQTFDDLVNWVNNGVRPAGDDILDPEKVSDTFYGCQFTKGTLPGEFATPEALRSGICELAQ
ncbi:MAG: hypothetical protein QNJ19_14075 [Woeseiaceae bacterium]|nr:hypothetical protein [Woeseiaceae bacterium]